jgi:hypothetical protein
VEPTTTLFPLRRDQRGNEIQRKALIAAVILAVVGTFVLNALPMFSSGVSLAVALAIIGYFATQYFLFIKA